MNKNPMPLLLVAAMAAAATAAEAPFDLLAACPGEDCSREMRIVWHSQSPDCVLGYAPQGGGERAIKAKCEKAKTPVAYTGQAEYWKYTATLGGLKPDTKYAYRVVSGGVKSPTQTFKTAGEGGEYNFLWIGDVHATPAKPKKMESVAMLVGNAEKAAKGGLDFVLSTGDLVKHGQTYSCWREWNGAAPFAKYMLAYVPGNKEYYQDKGKTRWHNRWFAASRNNPPNGAPGLESTFYFIYDGVMFVGIDTLAGEAKEMDDDQHRAARKGQFEWFEKVATAERGRYQYLVAFQHYPFFKKDGPSDYGNYEKWQPVFDRCGVDFALSGDSHSYVRSKQLLGGREDARGTVYVVCPEIDGYLGDAELKDGEGLVAKYDAKGSTYGACWFSVGKGQMTMHYFCKEAGDLDSVTVKAKRPPVGKRK